MLFKNSWASDRTGSNGWSRDARVSGAKIVAFFWGLNSARVGRAKSAGLTVMQTIGSADEARQAVDTGVDLAGPMIRWLGRPEAGRSEDYWTSGSQLAGQSVGLVRRRQSAAEIVTQMWEGAMSTLRSLRPD